MIGVFVTFHYDDGVDAEAVTRIAEGAAERFRGLPDCAARPSRSTRPPVRPRTSMSGTTRPLRAPSSMTT